MNRYKSSEIHIGESIMKSSDCGKPQGMKIDWKLLHADHAQNLHEKVNIKSRVLAQIPFFVYLEKWKLVINCFLRHNLITAHCIE